MNNKENTFVSAVIYVHNAERRIEKFLQAIIGVMENNFENSEIICVNDASDDGSVSAITNISMKVNKTSITLINMSYFHGIELAMNAGVDLAIGDFVFEFDNTNLDFDEKLIMQIYQRSLEGYDIVSASPDRKGKISSRIFYRAFERFSNITKEMTTESFRVLSRRAINRISSMNNNVLYRKALYANCGMKTDVIKYSVKETYAYSADSKEKSYRRGLAVNSLIVFTEVGYRVSVMMTILMMIISLFTVAYTIITYLLMNPVDGWTTTILFLSISFFGLFVILTIIIKYLQLLVDMTYKRTHYSFESIEKLTNGRRQ